MIAEYNLKREKEEKLQFCDLLVEGQVFEF
jgi:hypothetical protein